DISHESLIRLWWRLRGWVEREAGAADTYRRLDATAREWRLGRAALWGSPDLDVALAWEKEVRPNATWAARYGGDFTRAMDFLAASKRRRRMRRLQAGATVAVALMAAGAGVHFKRQGGLRQAKERTLDALAGAALATHDP